MSRIISINKSNYYILSGNSSDDGLKRIIEKEFDSETYRKFWECTFKLYNDYIKRQAGEVIGRLNRIIEGTHDETALDDFLKGDIKRKFPTNYLKLLEFIAYACSYSTSTIISDCKYASDKLTIEFVLNYFNKNIKDKIENKWLYSVSPIRYPVSKSFNKEVPLLIKGYDKYLTMIKKEKVHINNVCEQIESKYLKNKIVNVRIEFYRYDKYFAEIENTINIRLTKNIRLLLLKRSFKSFLYNDKRRAKEGYIKE
jgi:hypothetical protein